MSWFGKFFRHKQDGDSSDSSRRGSCYDTSCEEFKANASAYHIQDRQIRVFISSTFRDMPAERDGLVKKVFPQLRKFCEERAVVWTEVGVPSLKRFPWMNSTHLSAPPYSYPVVLTSQRSRFCGNGNVRTRMPFPPEAAGSAVSASSLRCMARPPSPSNTPMPTTTSKTVRIENNRSEGVFRILKKQADIQSCHTTYSSVTPRQTEPLPKR